ncbi:MAG: aspartate/glutamate racemase family protein [Gammaproteobacteria bacterium]|uniref:aspartate/glutamate racemase family protein n=1 Tax=Pseudacidovorax sp. TaxID=1934311 RepID=UPI001B5D8C5E|nr:amino acid racemase [Pseudacidovorax sp.]MBP6893982.1 amino acid racemase [Pseudacidovorax sp.]
MPVAASLPTMTAPEAGGDTPSLAPIGILGGMGPLATLDFMHKVLAATPARCDQDHLPLLVSSIPQIPDRTAAFLGEGVSPLPALVDSARRLADAGVRLLVMPCNTAHLWFEPLQAALGLPMLHLVDVALDEAVRQAPPGAALGLLATPATLASGLYVRRAGASVHWQMPTPDELARWVVPGIQAIKAGDLAQGETCLRQAAQALADRGARILVLGCTEIPLVLDAARAGLPVIDATAALARATVAWALAQRAGEPVRQKASA